VSEDKVVILIAEDEDSVRRTVQLMLQPQGYVLLSAADAAAALDLSRRHTGRLDLLLSDIRMPGPMDGFALARELIRERQGIRVLLMSGKMSDTTEVDALELPFLPKPFTAAKLRETVRRILEKEPPRPVV
jgi:DNA-binding NtrC family response regulator